MAVGKLKAKCYDALKPMRLSLTTKHHKRTGKAMVSTSRLLHRLRPHSQVFPPLTLIDGSDLTKACDWLSAAITAASSVLLNWFFISCSLVLFIITGWRSAVTLQPYYAFTADGAALGLRAKFNPDSPLAASRRQVIFIVYVREQRSDCQYGPASSIYTGLDIMYPKPTPNTPAPCQLWTFWLKSLNDQHIGRSCLSVEGDMPPRTPSSKPSPRNSTEEVSTLCCGRLRRR